MGFADDTNIPYSRMVVVGNDMLKWEKMYYSSPSNPIPRSTAVFNNKNSNRSTLWSEL